MAGPFKMQLRALLLSLILGLPSIALADHLHDTASDEASCEICAYSSPSVSGESRTQDCEPQESRAQQEKPRWLPFETYRLTERRRGPPLLR